MLLFNSPWGDLAVAVACFKFSTPAASCVRTLARAGGRHLHSTDRRTPAVLTPLPRNQAHPLYWESGFICRVLTSVSRLFWAPSPHPSWLRMLQAAVRRPHLFRSLVEIALAGNKRASARFTRALHLNSSRGVLRFSQMKLRLSVFFFFSPFFWPPFAHAFKSHSSSWTAHF